MLLYCLYYIVYVMLFILYYFYCTIYIVYIVCIVCIILYYIIILYSFCFRGILKNIGGVSPARKAEIPPPRFWEFVPDASGTAAGTGDRFAVRLVEALQGTRAGGG